jgi:pyrroloquinoline quinone (PQQ) biosynthesis protein C
MEQVAQKITDISNLNHPYLESLLDEAMNHRAVNHPYLKALASGSFANMPAVMRDFAGQYGFYSSWFPRYLTGVISKMENAEHRSHLLDNLAEESGHLHEEDMEAIRALGIKDEWVQGIPHPQLFKRFQYAIGAETAGKPGIEVEVWRDGFLTLIQNTNKSAANVVGAIGLGTESVVKYIYKYIIEAIEKHTDLTLEQYVFFPLHTEVDDEHGLILLDIARQMIDEGPQSAHEVRKGMLSALNMRACYWEDMMVRAQKLG